MVKRMASQTQFLFISHNKIAMEMAQQIASKSPVSTRMIKHTLNVIEDMSLRDGYRYEQDMTAAIAKTMS